LAQTVGKRGSHFLVPGSGSPKNCRRRSRKNWRFSRWSGGKVHVGAVRGFRGRLHHSDETFLAPRFQNSKFKSFALKWNWIRAKKLISNGYSAIVIIYAFLAKLQQ